MFISIAFDMDALYQWCGHLHIIINLIQLNQGMDDTYNHNHL